MWFTPKEIYSTFTKLVVASFLKVFSRNLTFTIALETSSSRTEKKNERIVVSSNCTLYIAKSRSRDKLRILKVSLVFPCTLFRVKCIVIRPQEIIFYSWSSTWKIRFWRAFSLKLNNTYFWFVILWGAPFHITLFTSRGNYNCYSLKWCRI